MAFTFPKEEKLKSQKTIELLFKNGKSVSKYPLRMVFLEFDFEEDVPMKMGVTVSKRYFKKAVDRNYVKRLMRESYRLNKKILHDAMQKKHACMLVYQSNEIPTFEKLNELTVQVFKKFAERPSSTTV